MFLLVVALSGCQWSIAVEGVRESICAKAEHLHVHLCVNLCKWRLAVRKTRVGTLANVNYVSGEIFANFWIVVFTSERYQTKETELLDVEAIKKDSCLAACASQRRQPGFFGDDAHAMVKRPQGASEHGLHTKCGPLRRWVN